MATDLTSIFGVNIKVFNQPAQVERMYTAFPGCDGLTSMNLGLRGKQIIITGMLYEYGANYEAGRAALQAWLNDLEALLTYEVTAQIQDYTFAGVTYQRVVFDRIQLVPDNEGKAIHYSSDGYAFCQFICFARTL